MSCVGPKLRLRYGCKARPEPALLRLKPLLLPLKVALNPPPALKPPLLRLYSASTLRRRAHRPVSSDEIISIYTYIYRPVSPDEMLARQKSEMLPLVNELCGELGSSKLSTVRHLAITTSPSPLGQQQGLSTAHHLAITCRSAVSSARYVT